MPPKADIKTLTFVQYTEMAPVELFKLAESLAVKPAESLETAKTKVVGSLKTAAKVVAAMKRLCEQRKEKREIPGDTSFAKYFADNVGGTLPGRVESLASLFNALVLTVDAQGKPLLPEEIFDNESTPVDWLEKASAIVNAARKKHGEAWKTCDEILDMVNALTRPGDAGKKLKAIHEQQKGKKTEGENADPAESGAAGKSTVAMTPELAAQFLIAAIEQACNAPEERQMALCKCVWDINTAWSGLPDALTAKLDMQFQRAAAHGVAPGITVITPETPAPAGPKAPKSSKNQPVAA